MTTISRDLKTGRSVWQAARLQPTSARALTANAEASVVIVGAGVSGAFIAEILAYDGHDVIVVDRRGVAQGSTAASTALVQYEIDEPLTVLSKKIGKADALRAWRRSHLAVAGIAARTSELQIECRAENRSSLYLAGDALGLDGMTAESEARRAAGMETVFLSRADLKRRFGISRAAGLLNFGNIGVNPRRLTAGYLQAAKSNGARIFAPVTISDVASTKRGVIAKTANGFRLKCKTLILATGYEFPKFVPMKGHKLISTFAMATKRQVRQLWPEQCFIWEASDPYLYMRTTEDGRAIIGGEDEDFVDETRRDALLAAKMKAIGRKASKLFPELDTAPDFAWAGTFGASATGLPTIGVIPGYQNCWAVLGYGGNGITGSRIAADIIRTALGGGHDPDADLYSFER